MVEYRPVTAAVAGSNPVNLVNGDIAQLVERCLCKADVSGSSPLISS